MATPGSKAEAKSKATAKAKAKGLATAARTAETLFVALRVRPSAQPPLLAGRRWGNLIDDARRADVLVVPDLALLQEARDNRDAYMPSHFMAAMLLGKRVATPSYCSSAAPGGGTSIRFLPALRKKFHVFFTAEFRASHPQLLNLFKKEARLLGEGRGTVELDTEANALALGPEKAMVVKSRVDFSNLVRKLATVARERGERGTFRK